jgi:hypothetical protein
LFTVIETDEDVVEFPAASRATAVTVMGTIGNLGCVQRNGIWNVEIFGLQICSIQPESNPHDSHIVGSLRRNRKIL